MKRIAAIILIVSALISLAVSCSGETDPVYREHMRFFVQQLSAYAKASSDSFYVVPQNGIELVFMQEDAGDKPAYDYLSAIDAVGQEDLFYGFRADNRPTPEGESEYLLEYLRFCEEQGVEVLVTDYCSDTDRIDDSYARNGAEGFISFAAPDRELNHIPSYPRTVNGENTEDITTPGDAKNFLYLINPENFTNKTEMIDAIAASSYDLVIIDLFLEEAQLDLPDLLRLKEKPQGGNRLILAYMSIGEAEDYRFYWQADWKENPPEWLLTENSRWEGNYLVEYWNNEWKSIIYGSENAYFDRIIASGFDGVYLDIIEAFEYFE